jgi:hypothetical protein
MKLIQGAIMLAAILGTGAAALAQDQDLEDTSMRGLTGIYVLVDKLPEVLKTSGILDVELESQVEIQLKKAGIKIIERPEALALRGKPFFYIQVRGAKPRGQPVYSIFVIGALVQRVSLERDPSLTGFARTWIITNFSSAEEKELRTQTTFCVWQVAQSFINSYLSVNPKP